MANHAEWELQRTDLLGRKISELGLSAHGTRVELLTTQLYDELAARGIAFRPPIYLSDEWGCPDGTPLIGVPFYLADERLERLEAEHAGAVETAEESMRFLRHEAGHAMNYAYMLHERDDFGSMFGDYSRPYEEHFPTDPLSRAYVRHILGWYAQKHPDEDFAETFAVWLTPGLDWRADYAGWPALKKLEWMDTVMTEIGSAAAAEPAVTDDDVPVHAMHWTVGDHYQEDERFRAGDGSQFDNDLKRIFASPALSPSGQLAGDFIASHERELLVRIAYWAGVGAPDVRSLLAVVRSRAIALDLRVAALEAMTLIELTAFGTAVLIHWRYTSAAPALDHDEDQ